MLHSDWRLMAKIRILPLDVEIDVSSGETVMGAAQGAGYYWPTTCGGEARCTTCACEVVSGADALSSMGRAERRALVAERGETVLSTPLRLACQARVIGPQDVTVAKPGVRRPLDACVLR
jgi:2Fe-2S ferredoxin